MIDLSALDLAVFARLASDADGAAVRAQLTAWGASAASIVMASDLPLRTVVEADRGALPARPILALRAGPAPRFERIVIRPGYTWLAIDDPSYGEGRLRALALLIAQAYESGLTVARDAIPEVEVSAGAVVTDPRLGQVLPIALAVGGV